MTSERWIRRRFLTIAVLVVSYVAVGAYFQLVLGMSILYTHFAYIPIVIAGVWWGVRGAWVAVAMVAVTLGLQMASGGEPHYGDHLARGGLFLVVAFCVGVLSDRAATWQRALRLSEEKYRLLVDKSLTGIWVYRDEKVLFANSQFAAMLGCSASELIGLSIWHLFCPDDLPRVRELVAKRKAEGFADLHYEVRLLAREGRIIWVELASSVADYEGRPTVLVNVYDITARKEAEAKRKELSELVSRQEEQLVHSSRLAELGEMAAAVAHELNQPLTGIRNFARNAFYMLDQSAGTPEEIKENLRLIAEQVDRSSKIINQMRELTRRGEREFAPVDLNGVLRESVAFLRPQLLLSSVEVTMDLNERLPDVEGDRIRLEQVFLNLITNARQAMESCGERKLTIRSCLEPGADLPVVVEVADTGPGFDETVRRKLFTPFFSTKQAGQGTGLGLSISLTIVNNHHGQIEAASRPGGGAIFRVRMPASQAEDGRER